MLRRAPAALVSLLALAAGTGVAGCASVDEDDLAAIEELPGVAYASSSCDLGGCHVSVRVGALDAEQLAAVLTTSRESDADSVSVRPDADGPEAGGAWNLELQAESDPEGDAPAAAAALALAGEPGVEQTIIVLDDEGTAVDLRTPSAPWDIAEEVWPEVEPLVSPRLSVTSEPPYAEKPSRLVADGALPDAAIAFVRSVEADGATGWTGAVVEGDAVTFGVFSVDAAETLELRAAQDAPDLDVRVVVSTDVLGEAPGSAPASRDDEPGTPSEADRRAVLAALAVEPGAWTRVQEGVVLVDGEDLDVVADLVDAARAAEPDAASRVPLTVGDRLDAAANRSDLLPDPGTAATSVQLHTDGSTELVRLVADLRAQPDLGVIDAGTPDPGRDQEAPYDADAHLFVQVGAPDLAAGVRRVSALLAAWAPADIASLTVSIAAVDPEGRSPQAGLRVERQGGTWVAVEGLDRQPEEATTTALAAWTAGAAG